MNEDDLDRMLREAVVPEQPKSYWDKFPGEVVLRLSSEGNGHRRRRFWPLAAAGFATAGAGLLLGFALWHRNGLRGPDAAELRDGRVLQALETEFPGRLQAIIMDARGVRPQLSALSDVSESDPIWLEIREGKERRVVVTFSGQVIRCGGRDVVVLADHDGQVMLLGPGFLWSPQASAGEAEGVEIKAEQLTDRRKDPTKRNSL